MTVPGSLSEKLGMAKTLEGLKCFIPRIFLAAAGMASMVVRVDEGSSWRKVGRWQWSGLS